MADTTATQRCSLLASTIIFAALAMHDASPTDVPPNFITCSRFSIPLLECGKFTPTPVGASLPPSRLHALAGEALTLVRSGSSIVRLHVPCSPAKPPMQHRTAYIFNLICALRVSANPRYPHASLLLDTADSFHPAESLGLCP